jgi:hypothetical protein
VPKPGTSSAQNALVAGPKITLEGREMTWGGKVVPETEKVATTAYMTITQ